MKNYYHCTGGVSYIMEHDTIELRSNNKHLVLKFETMLEDISASDIKLGKIEKASRYYSGIHALLLDLGFAGDSPLSDEYFEVRTIKHNRFMALRDQYKNTSQYTLKAQACMTQASNELLESRGWDLGDAV